MKDHKIVHDSVHGSIRLEGVFLSMLEAPELQRLHGIHQLGLAYLVFPGANHTRFEHSLGTFEVARRISRAIGLEDHEATTVESAAFLHDIGHLPYSHTLEFVLHGRFGIDHADISRRLILGEESILSDSDRKVLGAVQSVPEILERHGIDVREVASLLKGIPPSTESQKTLQKHKDQAHFNARRYLSQIVNGPIDADQLDYLRRDAHYTGVAYGVIDFDRVIHTLEVFNGDLVVDKGGLSAVEGILVARSLMFSAVYMHKTVRISELMLAKAVELLGEEGLKDIHSMTDASLLSYLVSKGGYCGRTATMIKYRHLFKKAYSVRAADLSDESWTRIDELADFAKRRSLEEDIARRAGVTPGEVIIDVPSSELTVSEPRLSMTDLRVLDDGKVRMLSRISSIAMSLQTRKVHEWGLMVACPSKHRERVCRSAEKVLGL